MAAGETNSRLIVLDAKYRIEDGLNEALNSIHTCRAARWPGKRNRVISKGSCRRLICSRRTCLGWKKNTGRRRCPVGCSIRHIGAVFRFGETTLLPDMAAD